MACCSMATIYYFTTACMCRKATSLPLLSLQLFNLIIYFFKFQYAAYLISVSYKIIFKLFIYYIEAYIGASVDCKGYLN